MKTSSKTLLNDLIERSRNIMNAAEQMKALDESVLNKRRSSDSWSALECLEHLNLYGHFYLPEFRSCIEKSKFKSEALFQSGLVGNYSAESMLPGEKMKKMKTFKDKNPLGSSLSITTIDEFLDQQKQMLDSLSKAREVSLSKTKTATTLPVIRFKLGDTFRFVIYHNERHIEQAKKALKYE